MSAIVSRLEALLPELEYSRETHVQWANCSPESRARNPDIGDADFHNRCIVDYDERIEAIKEAIEALKPIPQGFREGARRAQVKATSTRQRPMPPPPMSRAKESA